MRSVFRKPSLKKSFSARTKGRGTRAMKSLLNPTYGKKGMGLAKNPKKAVYNKVYNKTSIGINDIVKTSSHSKSRSRSSGGYPIPFLSSSPEYDSSAILEITSSKDGKKYVLSPDTSLRVPSNTIETSSGIIAGGVICILIGLVGWIFSSVFAFVLFGISALFFIGNYNFEKGRAEELKEASERIGKKVDDFVIEVAQKDLPILLKKIKECLTIISTTTNADVYLKNYDIIIECLEELSLKELLFNYYQGTPSEVLQIFQEGKEEITDKFLDRCYEATADKISKLKTKRGKTNNAQKFYDGLAEYADKMTAENVEHLEKLYSDLLSKIEEPQIVDEDKEECLQ